MLRFVNGFFVRSDGSSWIFVSGLVLSLGGNIVVSALSPETLPGNWARLLAAASLLVLSSGMFAAVGWLLQRLEALARGASANGVDDIAAVKTRLVGATYSRIVWILVGGLASAAAGLGVLAVR
jgi:hypothetical protein